MNKKDREHNFNLLSIFFYILHEQKNRAKMLYFLILIINNIKKIEKEM
jgi:hypothetical protein